MSSVQPSAFFTRVDDAFLPTDASAGYWTPDSLTGRVIGGLLGYGLERDFMEPGLVPARFTVDLFRLAPRRPLQVVTRLVRSGGRMIVADAELLSDGIVVARASCQFLRRSDNPATPTWQATEWSAPPPLTLPRTSGSDHWDLRGIPAATPEEAAPASDPAPGGNPPVLGALAPFGARQAWVRESRTLVAGEPLTPFTRIALAADFASPLANSSEHGIDFVNSDMTVYLHRLPATDWIGFKSVFHKATDGVAIGECSIRDEQGLLGSVTVAALAQRQR